jgi:hypothetical protein
MVLYKKLVLIVLVSNLVVLGFLIIKKNVLFSRVSFNKNNN